MNALFIGRFQPFHKGHLKVLKKISKEYNKIIIGIGSSQYSHTQENPFTAEERKNMIEKTLMENDINNFEICLIPDIHNLSEWVDYASSITPRFHIVVTNSDLTRKLFEEKSYTVEGTKMYNRDRLSGEEIRKKIINKEKWRHLVPRTVYDFITNIKGENRIRNCYDK
ncbi:MAG: nicotinamide-nucleotide adenylyltransferase [Candidatus Thermoplasmatota archaeon]